MKKSTFVIIVCLSIFALLIVIYYFVVRKGEAPPSSSDPTITPTVTPQIIIDQYDEEDKQALVDDLTQSGLPDDVVIKDFIWLPATTLPSELPQMPAYSFTPDDQGRTYSPGKTSYAYVDGKNLQISTAATDMLVKSIPFSEDYLDLRLIWLREQLLMVVEKENTDLKIDRFYLIDVNIGKKTFITGSFPVPKRINLKINPIIYSDGALMILTDNDNNLWQLSFIYK